MRRHYIKHVGVLITLGAVVAGCVSSANKPRSREDHMRAARNRALSEMDRCVGTNTGRRGASSELTVTLHLDDQGAVERVEPEVDENSTMDPSVERCLLLRLKELEFPAPRADHEKVVGYSMYYR